MGPRRKQRVFHPLFWLPIPYQTLRNANSLVLYTVEICISTCKSVYNMQSLYNPNMCFGNGNKYFEFEFEFESKVQSLFFSVGTFRFSTFISKNIDHISVFFFQINLQSNFFVSFRSRTLFPKSKSFVLFQNFFGIKTVQVQVKSSIRHKKNLKLSVSLSKDKY